MDDGRFVETKMRSGPGHSALAGEVIFHDSNAKFQCVIGFAHKNAPYSVGVQLLGCSSKGRGYKSRWIVNLKTITSEQNLSTCCSEQPTVGRCRSDNVGNINFL